jgi:hypothetical protein
VERIDGEGEGDIRLSEPNARKRDVTISVKIATKKNEPEFIH